MDELIITWWKENVQLFKLSHFLKYKYTSIFKLNMLNKLMKINSSECTLIIIG